MAAADVERIAIAERAGIGIHTHSAVGANVENAKFAALSKRSRAKFAGGWQRQGFNEWNSRTDHRAVEVDVDKPNGAGSKEVFKQEARTQFFRRHLLVSYFICELK